MPPISGAWAKALEGEFHKPYYKKLFETVGKEYATHQIFPAGDDIFNAFHFTPLDQVKVVILGQDPYHGDGQAHGLCFSVKPDVEIPPSLVNIYKELEDDLGCYIPNNGYLEKGKTGCSDVKHSSDRTCSSGKFPSGDRLGRIYRCGYSGVGGAGSPDGFYPLGQTGSE